MKNLKKKLRLVLMFKLLLTLGCVVLAFSLQAQQIKGQIANYDKIKVYFAKDSYLQLYELQKGERMFLFDNKGRMYIESKLARAKVSPDGTFVFTPDNLTSGTYYISAQILQGRGASKDPALVNEKYKAIKIEIKENTKTPIDIDLGKCYVWE